MKKYLLLSVLLFNLIVLKISAQTWSALGGGTAGPVYAVAVWKGNLYAAGNFPSAGGVPATNIAKWDTATSLWSPLGLGLGSGINRVYALCVYDTTLYAAGDFTTPANRIARWDGSTWTGLGTGVNDSIVKALIVFNGALFVGGNFLTVNGQPCQYAAMWDGSAWSYPSAQISTDVYCFAIHNSELFAGGDVLPCIYKWFSPSTIWDSISTPFTAGNWVQSMASYGGTLYASGGFSPTFTTGIAKWNGTTWSTLSPGFNAGAYASVLMPFNGYLYAGGGFTNAGPSGAKHLATWDGTTWRQGISGNSVDNTVFAFDTLSSPKIIYAGGLFSNPYSRVMRSNSLVAIEEQSLPEESVSIFPNPATDNILISLRSELKNPQVEIYNVAGEKIYSQMLTTRQKTINIRNYAAGIYFVKITSAGNDATGGVKALTKKIVIE